MNLENKLRQICNIYKNTNKLRYLFMKLPTFIESDKLFIELNKQNIIIKTDTNLKTLFDYMKGYINIEYSAQSNRVRDIKYYHTEFARDCVIQFAFRILNNKITNDDQIHVYNTSFYILTHPKLFTNRIRHHLYKIIIKYNLLNSNQLNKINLEKERYGHLSQDTSSTTESDSEEESETNIYHDDYGHFYDYD